MLISEPRIPIKDVLIYGFLPSPIKKFVYRLKGYRIGKKVSIGLGSVICGEDVHVGDYTTVGFFTIIRGKRITIGSHVSIGTTTFLDTPYLEIGDGSHINEQVFVGGLQFPDSKLVLGRNCQIMQMSFINPAKSIIVGDDTGIGGHCLLFGHTSWLSQFEGYPVEFLPIEIGNSVSLAWRVFVLPGTKIGDGAVIGANSLVRGTVPPKSLAVGFPARVVSKFPSFPKEVTEEEKVGMFRNIVSEMIAYFTDSGLFCEREGLYYSVTHVRKEWWLKRKRTWRLQVQDGDISQDKIDLTSINADVFLSLRTIPKELRRALNAKRVMWIDIDKKEQSRSRHDLGEEVTNFLRRYGVRFYRVEE